MWFISLGPGEHTTERNYYARTHRAGKKVPQEIIDRAKQLASDKKGLNLLFEDFVQSGEKWSNSCFIRNLELRKTKRRVGRVRLFTQLELEQRYGVELAKTLMKKKEQDGMTVAHPELAGVKLFRCFDSQVEETLEEQSDVTNLQSTGELDEASAAQLG